LVSPNGRWPVIGQTDYLVTYCRPLKTVETGEEEPIHSNTLTLSWKRDQKRSIIIFN
jgi:hypothetical protein